MRPSGCPGRVPGAQGREDCPSVVKTSSLAWRMQTPPLRRPPPSPAPGRDPSPLVLLRVWQGKGWGRDFPDRVHPCPWRAALGSTGTGCHTARPRISREETALPPCLCLCPGGFPRPARPCCWWAGRTLTPIPPPCVSGPQRALLRLRRAVLSLEGSSFPALPLKCPRCPAQAPSLRPPWSVCSPVPILLGHTGLSPHGPESPHSLLS